MLNVGKPQYVEVSVTNINERGVFLTIKDHITLEVVDAGLTAEELFARTDVVISSAYYPLDSEIESVAFDNPRKMIDDLRALDNEQSRLREELHSTSNSERYKLLSAGNGPLRDIDRKLKVQRMICEVSFVAMFGVRPSEFRNLSLY